MIDSRNTRRLAHWGSASAVAAGLCVACGSSGGSSGSKAGALSLASFETLRTQYTSPSGTLDASEIPAVEAALSQEEGSATVMRQRVAPHSLEVATVHPLSSSVSCAPATANGMVTCSCSVSGSITESVVGTSGDVVEETANYDSCVEEEADAGETDSLSGTLSFADFETAPAMIIYSGTLSDTVTPPGTTTTIDLDYAIIGGVITYDVMVASGNVLVSLSGSWDPTTDSGAFTVTDKTGTWTCNLTDGSGSCTNGSGGTITVTGTAEAGTGESEAGASVGPADAAAGG